MTNVRALRERTTLLAEDAGVADRLHGLLTDLKCSGKQVHDANVVATVLAHGVGMVVTMNLVRASRPLLAEWRPSSGTLIAPVTRLAT